MNKKIQLLFVVTLLLLLHTTIAYPTFAEFVLQYKKSYDGAEYTRRQAIYNQKIASFANYLNFIPGVNKFTDWTQEEISGLSQLKLLPQSERISTAVNDSPRLGTPVSLDWRQSNIITSIKDQQSCGSCWAFTSTVLIQSYLVKNGNQTIDVDLSQQYLIQCTQDSTCNGGYIENGIDKMLTTAVTQNSMPYQNSQANRGSGCSTTGIPTNVVRQSKYNLTDSDLINLLQSGPVAVAVASASWSSYSSGMITCPSQDQIDHAVVAVGYTADAYIIKNSWGTSWGLDGYALISRTDSGNCKILNQGHIVNKPAFEWKMLTSFFILAIILMLS